MKRAILLLFIVLPLFMFGQADKDTTWKFSGTMGLKLNQTSFTNWAPGGTNSYSFSGLAKLYANYRKDKISWENNLNLMYGMLKEKDENISKNEDLIDFTSVLGRDIAKKWAFTGMLNFKTQFANGFDADYDTVKISTIMAPAYLTISPAFRYQPVEWFQLYLSPITAKMTFVLDQELADKGSFGVTPAEYDTLGNKITDGEKMLFYLGPFLEAYLKKDLAKNLNFESKLNVMYTFLNRDNLEGYDVDFNWENFLNYQFAKFFSVNLFVHFAYLPGQPEIVFEEVDGVVIEKAVPNRKLQIKETLGIGLSYTFPTAE
jgi:hypothetical protein